MIQFDFTGKTALVTGGGTGIGRAVATALGRAGANVFATILSGQEQESIASGSIRFLPCDVTSDAALDDTFKEIRALDFVIHCAGTIGRADEFQVEAFARVIDVNLTSAMRINTRALPLLSERGGCIVHTASMLSFFGSGYAPAYSASKGGVVQLTKSLAIAWARHGIRVNAVAPGWIATQFTQTLQDNSERSRQIIDRTPLGRWGTADEITGPILFLCSPAAAFITGATLIVDGGYSAV